MYGTRLESPSLTLVPVLQKGLNTPVQAKVHIRFVVAHKSHVFMTQFSCQMATRDTAIH